MSRLPSEAASRNMSACSAQAMSQVGCRLMVASSANTSRPLAPARCGDVARALATKAAMSSAADGRASGSGGPLRAPAARAVTSSADFGLIGSPAMCARHLQRTLCGAELAGGNVPPAGVARGSSLHQLLVANDVLLDFSAGTLSDTGPGSRIFGGAFLV